MAEKFVGLIATAVQGEEGRQTAASAADGLTNAASRVATAQPFARQMLPCPRPPRAFVEILLAGGCVPRARCIRGTLTPMVQGRRLSSRVLLSDFGQRSVRKYWVDRLHFIHL